MAQLMEMYNRLTVFQAIENIFIFIFFVVV